MNRVKFPISLKLIVLMTFLVGVSLTGYVFYAVNLFDQDKTAYIYEQALNDVTLINKEYSQKIASYLNTLKLLSSDSNFEEIFRNQFIQAIIIESKNNRLLKTSGNLSVLLLDDIKRNVNTNKINHLTQIKNKAVFQILNLKEGFKSLILSLNSGSFTKYLIIDMAFLSSIMGRSDTFDNLIFNKVEDFIIQKKQNKNPESVRRTVLKEASRLNAPSVVKDIQISGEDFIIALSEMDGPGLMAASLISKKQAFLATSVLIKQSVLFGFLILSVIGFFIVLFSRILTKPINTLYGQTLEVSSGNFDVRFDGKSQDEIGGLGGAFNLMVEKIVFYMNEMKEKARLEKEMEVAQLVQNSFFPDHEIKHKLYELETFYEPATECGGDWWGHIEGKDRSIIIIADASGHGVPAALITAVANCCKENLKNIWNDHPDTFSTPSEILNFMSQAIKNSSHNIFMTAFIAILDHKTSELSFANASHNPPFIFNQGEKDHKAIKTLLSKPGPRLGEVDSHEYEVNSLIFDSDKHIVFFTDGILEAQNPEGKQYGNRRFLKSLINAQGESEALSLQKILSEFNQFVVDIPHDDDITILSLYWKNATMTQTTSLIEESNQEKTPEQLREELLKEGIYINKTTDEEAIHLLKKHHQIGHIIGGNTASVDEELLATKASLVDNNFIDHLLQNPDFTKSFEFNNYHKAVEDISIIIDDLSFDEFFDSPKAFLKTLSNELLSNAFYHADQTGSDRVENKVMNDHVTFSIARNAKYLAITCRDPFGSLNRQTIVDSLYRASHEKTYQENNQVQALVFISYSITQTLFPLMLKITNLVKFHV
jgi:sigma-B regulation protein RsbU (phosphoserine phosphatase)